MIFEKLFNDTIDIKNWFLSRKESILVNIKQIKFSEINQWYFENETENYKHNTGKFFSIVGVDISTNWGLIDHWTQPIIRQTEIGILEIITK